MSARIRPPSPARAVILAWSCPVLLLAGITTEATAQRGAVRPRSATVAIPSAQGPIRVRNFYGRAAGCDPLSDSAATVGILCEGEFSLQRENYSISYWIGDHLFRISLTRPPLDSARTQAEQALLELLGVGWRQACQLSVTVSALSSADPSGTLMGEYPLSQCQSLGAIRRIDFRNFSFPVSGAKCQGLFPGIQEVRVRDGVGYRTGRYERGVPSLNVYTVAYGDLTGDDKDEAVVLVDCSEAGFQSEWDGEILVFTLSRTGGSLLASLVPGVLPPDFESWSDDPQLTLAVTNGRLHVGRAAEGRRTGGFNMWYVTTQYLWAGGSFNIDAQTRRRCSARYLCQPARPR